MLNNFFLEPISKVFNMTDTPVTRKMVRDWVFTLNNPEGQIEWPADKVTYAIWQEEAAPTTGTIHYQGFVVLKRSQRISYVKKLLPTAHWEARKGTREQAISYCEKSETKVAGPWTFGKIKRQGQRTDLEEAMKLVQEGCSEVEIANRMPSTWCHNFRALERYRRLRRPNKRTWQTKVIVRWGPTGSGKTRPVFEEHPDVREMYYRNSFWSTYSGEEVVLWDDFDPRCISRQEFLTLTDRYPCQVRQIGGWAEWLPQIIYITSNFSPDDWYNRDPAVQRRIAEVVFCGFEN